MPVGNFNPLTAQQFIQHIAAENAEISCYYPVVILHPARVIRKMSLNRFKRGRSHRRPHIICIRNAEILHAADGAARKCNMFKHIARTRTEFTRRLNDYASRTRDRTLTARNGLNAHFQRIAKLPFGCRKVTACGTRGKLCKASVNKHSAEHQSLADG